MDKVTTLIDDFSSSILAKRIKEVIRELHDVRPRLLFQQPAKPELSELLLNADEKELFQPEPVMNRKSAGAVIGGLLVWNDSFEAAHSIIQNNNTPEGCYIHAIIHRREPDMENSGYWFSQTGNHPIYPLLHDFVSENAAESVKKAILDGDKWSPERFNAFFETVLSEKSGDNGELAAIQLAELLFLIAHSYRHTIGT